MRSKIIFCDELLIYREREFYLNFLNNTFLINSFHYISSLSVKIDKNSAGNIYRRKTCFREGLKRFFFIWRLNSYREFILNIDIQLTVNLSQSTEILIIITEPKQSLDFYRTSDSGKANYLRTMFLFKKTGNFFIDFLFKKTANL